MVSIRGSWIPLPAVSSRSTRSARSSLTARSCSSAIGTGRRRAHRRSSRSTANASCARAIIDWCRDNMAAFKVPRIVEFVAELPKSGSGKIQWRELQERERMRKSS
ncbi:MAG: AMP-binding enzyme [Steroidobacteraceae bacterium]